MSGISGVWLRNWRRSTGVARLLACCLILCTLTACAVPVTVTNQSASGSSSGEQGTTSDVESPVGCERTPGACATERLLTAVVDYLTFFAELCGALVIAVAVVRGVVRYIPHIFRPEHRSDTYAEDIRLQLGKSLALALEFELGADILKTAVAPSFAIISQLAAIIVLRTALNYFLERELRQTEQRRAGQHLQSGGAE